jgi:hypothetical protein
MKWKELTLKERKQIYDAVRAENPNASYLDIKAQFDLPSYGDGTEGDEKNQFHGNLSTYTPIDFKAAEEGKNAYLGGFVNYVVSTPDGYRVTPGYRAAKAAAEANKRTNTEYYELRKNLSDLRQEQEKKYYIDRGEDTYKLTKAGKLTGATISDNMLDEIYKYGVQSGLDPVDYFGIPAQETALGNTGKTGNPFFYEGGYTKDKIVRPSSMVSDWIYRNYIWGDQSPFAYLNNLIFPEDDEKYQDIQKRRSANLERKKDFDLRKKRGAVTWDEYYDILAESNQLDNEYYEYTAPKIRKYQRDINKIAEKAKEDVPTLLHSFLDYKSRNPNPGDPKYKDKVRASGKLLMNSPEFKAWAKKRGYEFPAYEDGEDDVAASYSLPEISIYPNNRFGDIARNQGLQTARNWQAVKDATTEGINSFARDPRTQFMLSVLPMANEFDAAGAFMENPAVQAAAAKVIKPIVGFAKNKIISKGVNKAVKSADLPTEDILKKYNSIDGSTGNASHRFRVGDIEVNDPNLNYRQGDSAIVDDFLKSGKVTTGEGDESVFASPMFAQGQLWYGIPTAESIAAKTTKEKPKGLISLLTKGRDSVKDHLLVTAEELLPANQHARGLNPHFGPPKKPRMLSSEEKSVFNDLGMLDIAKEYDKNYQEFSGFDNKLLSWDRIRRIPDFEDQLNKGNTAAYIFKPNYGYKKLATDNTANTIAWGQIPTYQDGKGSDDKLPASLGYTPGTQEYYERAARISGRAETVQPEAYLTPAGYVKDAMNIGEDLANGDYAGAAFDAAANAIPYGVGKAWKSLRRGRTAARSQEFTPTTTKPRRLKKKRTEADYDAEFAEYMRRARNADKYNEEITQTINDAVNPSEKTAQLINEVDATYGTDYKGAYSKIANKDKQGRSKYVEMTPLEDGILGTTSMKDANGRFSQNVDDYKMKLDLDEYVPGTGNHELGHISDGLAGSNKVNNFEAGGSDVVNPYLNYLADSRNTYSSAELRKMGSRVSPQMRDYLLNPTESKSHMLTLKRSMVRNGYLKSWDEPLTQEMVENYFKDHHTTTAVKQQYSLYKNKQSFVDRLNKLVPMEYAAPIGMATAAGSKKNQSKKKK